MHGAQCAQLHELRVCAASAVIDDAAAARAADVEMRSPTLV
jgi:hypothetical protein